MGRSMTREVKIAFSEAFPSRLLKPPGILPTEYNFSSYSTLKGKKSIPSLGFSDAVAVHNTISSYKFTSTAQPNSELVAEPSVEKSIPEELPVTLITKKIPSPLTDPNPLLKQFEMSMELADKDLIPDKILVRIQADEEGNIVSATTDHDDNPEVRVAVERATNQIAFEVVKDGDRKVSTRFALPIRKVSLPM